MDRRKIEIKDALMKAVELEVVWLFWPGGPFSSCDALLFFSSVISITPHCSSSDAGDVSGTVVFLLTALCCFL